MESIIKIVEDLGWNISYEDYGEQYLVELDKSTPAGEDFVFSFWFDKTIEDFEREILNQYMEFDPEEHVEELLEAKKNGLAGVPSLFDLVDDAKEIQAMIYELWKAIHERGKRK